MRLPLFVQKEYFILLWVDAYVSSIASSRIIFSSDIVSLEKIILELDVAWASTQHDKIF